MRRLAAHLDQRMFSEKQPAKDWDERFERAKSTMKNLISIGEKKLAGPATATAPSVEEEKKSDLPPTSEAASPSQQQPAGTTSTSSEAATKIK